MAKIWMPIVSLLLAALILGDGLLLGMILGGKIDTLFGVLFVAVLSALCGAKVKR